MIIQNCLVELVAKYESGFNYFSYVFKYLDPDDIARFKDKYLICTRYPNWQCRDLKEGDKGYVEIEVVRAGIDTWYDGEKQVPFKNNAKRFIRFIDKPSNNPSEFTL